jgi:hypothetical protein
MECKWRFHERAAGYPYESSRGKAARSGTSQEVEHMLYRCVWMHSTPTTSRINWPITLSGAPRIGKRFWLASLICLSSRKSVVSAKRTHGAVGALHVQEDHVQLFRESLLRVYLPRVTGSHPERCHRTPRVSTLSASEEISLGWCVLVSFVLRRQCRRYERGYRAHIYRIGTRVHAMNASDRRLVFRLGFVPSLHERPNHLAIREPEREERHRR